MKTFAIQCGCQPLSFIGGEMPCRASMQQEAGLATLVFILQKYHDLQDSDLTE